MCVLDHFAHVNVRDKIKDSITRRAGPCMELCGFPPRPPYTPNRLGVYGGWVGLSVIPLHPVGWAGLRLCRRTGCNGMTDSPTHPPWGGLGGNPQSSIQGSLAHVLAVRVDFPQPIIRYVCMCFPYSPDRSGCMGDSRARGGPPYTPNNRLGVYGGFARARGPPIHPQPVGGVWGIRARGAPIHPQQVGCVWGARARARESPIHP